MVENEGEVQKINIPRGEVSVYQKGVSLDPCSKKIPSNAMVQHFAPNPLQSFLHSPLSKYESNSAARLASATTNESAI